MDQYYYYHYKNPYVLTFADDLLDKEKPATYLAFKIGTNTLRCS